MPLEPVLVEPPKGWAHTLFEQLPPGAHAVVITRSEIDGIAGRSIGFELRDTLAVLSPGPMNRFALLFRKPLTETSIIEQVVSTRSGALNIDDCRACGRWPSNFVIVHDPACRLVGEKPVKSTPAREGETRSGGRALVPSGDGLRPNVGDTPLVRYGNEFGYELVPDWRCSHTCPSRFLNESTGDVSHYYPQFSDDQEMVSWFKKLVAA